MHDRYAAEGLAILGFPANNSLWQEPGSDAQIKQFCTVTYGVAFDMFAMVSVKGRDACAHYRLLTSQDTNPEFGGENKWNFAMFLLNRKGEVIARFGPRKRPLGPESVDAIVAAL